MSRTGFSSLCLCVLCRPTVHHACWGTGAGQALIFGSKDRTGGPARLQLSPGHLGPAVLQGALLVSPLQQPTLVLHQAPCRAGSRTNGCAVSSCSLSLFI